MTSEVQKLNIQQIAFDIAKFIGWLMGLSTVWMNFPLSCIYTHLFGSHQASVARSQGCPVQRTTAIDLEDKALNRGDCSDRWGLSHVWRLHSAHLFSTLATIVDIVSQPGVQRNSGAQRAFVLKFLPFAKPYSTHIDSHSIPSFLGWGMNIM